MQGEQGGGQSLGEPIRVFRVRPMTRTLAFVCSIIIVAGGVFLIVRDFSDGIALSFGWIPLPAGLCALGFAYIMGKSSYLVCPDGVIRVRLGHRLYCRWDEVNEIVDAHVKQGLVSSRSCTLVKKNGARLELHDLGITDFAVMIDLIRQQADSRGIPWKEHVSDRV